MKKLFIILSIVVGVFASDVDSCSALYDLTYKVKELQQQGISLDDILKIDGIKSDAKAKKLIVLIYSLNGSPESVAKEVLWYCMKDK